MLGIVPSSQVFYKFAGLVRFGAATLHLQTCDDAEIRIARSTQQAESLTAMLAESKITAVEKDDLAALVVTTTDGWSASDRSKILRCIDAACKPKRRNGQVWSHNILNIFTDEEWNRWKENGLSGMNDTLVEICARIKNIGGKNLCEPDKKLLTAMWLSLRGDGRQLTSSGRKLAQDSFSSKLARTLRGFEPSVYLEELPSLEEFETRYPVLYAATYCAGKPPVRMPVDLLPEVMFLDAAMKCRGHGTELQQTLVAQPRSHMLPVQPNASFMEQLQILQSIMVGGGGGGGGGGGRGGDIPITYNMDNSRGLDPPPPRPPTGRPMRCVTNVHADASANLRRAETFVEEAPAASAEGVPSLVTHGAAAEVDARDSIAKVAERMLKRKKAADDIPESEESETGEESEEEAVQSEAAEVVQSKAAKGKKATAKKKAAAEPKGKALKLTPSKAPKGKALQITPTKLAVKARGLLRKGTKAGCEYKSKPFLAFEHSRNQVMCRTGKGGPGSSFRIPFDGNGGKAGAWKKGEEWLKREMKTYKLSWGGLLL